MIEKVDQYRSWLMQRYSSFKSELYKLASHEALDIQAPVIRTLVEVELNFFEPAELTTSTVCSI